MEGKEEQEVMDSTGAEGRPEGHWVKKVRQEWEEKGIMDSSDENELYFLDALF